MTAVLKNAGVMHLTYYANRLTTTKVDSTSLAVNQQCITYMCVGATKGTYRSDIKMIVNHDYIKQCIIFTKNFFS